MADLYSSANLSAKVSQVEALALANFGMRARTYTAHAAVLTVVILAAQSLLAQSCTVIAAGKAATTDGSVFVSHTDDQSPSTADLR